MYQSQHQHRLSMLNSTYYFPRFSKSTQIQKMYQSQHQHRLSVLNSTYYFTQFSKSAQIQKNVLSALNSTYYFTWFSKSTQIKKKDLSQHQRRLSALNNTYYFTVFEKGANSKNWIRPARLWCWRHPCAIGVGRPSALFRPWWGTAQRASRGYSRPCWHGSGCKPSSPKADWPRRSSRARPRSAAPCSPKNHRTLQAASVLLLKCAEIGQLM